MTHPAAGNNQGHCQNNSRQREKATTNQSHCQNNIVGSGKKQRPIRAIVKIVRLLGDDGGYRIYIEFGIVNTGVSK